MMHQGGQGPGSPEGDAPSMATNIAERIRKNPEAILCDDVLSYAVALDDVGFERLRKRLSDGYASREDLQAFVRSVKARKKADVAERKGRRVPIVDRPQIVITVDEGAVNEQCAAALSRLPGLYTRMGTIVRVATFKRRKPGEPDPYEVTEIREVAEPLLREYCARAATWVDPQEDPTGGPSIPIPAHPPDWSVKAVRALGGEGSLLPLYHVAESPVLLPDGRVIQESGYDVPTGIMVNSKIAVDVPDVLTREDSQASGAMLLDLVAQVPFEDAAHRSAWVAALLTVVARWAFRGCCPLFMLDANRPGTGKDFLINIISDIALGRRCDMSPQTADEEEEKKFITSKVLTAQPMVLINECDKPFGSGPLQGVLTSGVWAPRLLGTNDSPSYSAYIVWFAAGNNVQLKTPDIERRTCFVRIVTPLADPAARTGFKYDDMDAHVAMNRADLFRACLVMLRAWLNVRMDPTALEGWGGRWGGFNDWDRVVRGAIVYAGLPDPIGAKATRVAPTAREGVADLVLGLEEVIEAIGKAGEVSSAAVHTALAENDAARKDARAYGPGTPAPPLRFETLRKGLASLLPQLKGASPSVAQLGTLLGRNHDQAAPAPDGTRKWIRRRHADGGLWRVEIVPAPDVQLEDEPSEREALRAV